MSTSIRVLVIAVPKRLCYFIHRRPESAGEVSRLLARENDLFHLRALGPGLPVRIYFA